MDKAQQNYFTKRLMHWHETDNHRTMPWKEEKDPYKIWLSEIILQQTRTEQGLPYYLNFIDAYPTIVDMAAAVDEDVFRLWQGLGYYNRCRNMLATARMIVNEMNGAFPSTYEDILKLKGVGPYTAAAIASFAYGLPNAVVDGNVYRVLARFFGIDTPIDSTEGKKQFALLADQLLYNKDSAAYNQAIMDLGATVCKPAAPICDTCLLQKKCFAYNHSLIADLPVKTKKLKVKERFFHYIFFTWKDSIWIQKRTGNDIWQNLYQPYLIEHDSPMTIKEVALKLDTLNITETDVEYAGSVSQRLTHRIIQTAFYIVHSKHKNIGLPTSGKWVSFNDLNNYAFPKSIISFIEKKSYF